MGPSVHNTDSAPSHVTRENERLNTPCSERGLEGQRRPYHTLVADSPLCPPQEGVKLRVIKQRETVKGWELGFPLCMR